jgi:hypothetical protein
MASRAKFWSWVVVAAMAASAGVTPAQQPGAVPTDHYGPPACTAAAKPPVKSDALERARAERKDALDDSRMILSDEPLANFGIERYKLAAYGDCTGDSGCYWADLDAQYKRAEVELTKELAAKKPGEKLAIVMDIDETTLTNYCEMRREDFGYLASLYRAYELTGTAVAIPGALRLFNEAREAGVSVFFITGRPGRQDAKMQRDDRDETNATARNLEAAEFHGWAGLRLRNGEENHMPTISFKTQERRKIVADGYRIILSVGDQWSDLLGSPQADVSVKLPNPFYFIP